MAFLFGGNRKWADLFPNRAVYEKLYIKKYNYA